MKIRSGTIRAAVTALTLLGVAVGSASAVTEFDRAARLTLAGDHDGALREYEAFLSRAPDDPRAPVAAAAVANIHLEVRHDTTAAIVKLNGILADHRSSQWASEAARMKGACEEARARWSEAGEAYELAFNLAIEQDHGASDDWINQVTMAAANCYDRAGNPPKVIHTYQKVLESSPPPEVAATALYQLGEHFETAEQPEDAARSFARVIEEYPSSQVFQRAMEKRGLIDRHLAIEWTPFEVYAEGMRLINQGDFENALGTCKNILETSKNPALRECVEYRQISLETTQSGDYTNGCGRLESYLDLHPHGLRTDTAQQTLEERWRPLARLEARARTNPEDVEILRALGQGYVRARSIEKGIETLEAARDLDPEDATTQLMLGYAYAGAARNEEALAAFTAYLDQNPTDVNTLNMIGYSYLGTGQIDEALPYFEKYVELAPDEANAHDSYGEGLMRAGRLEESAREYEKAIEVDPSFFNSYFMLGQVYQQLENPTKAMEAYEGLLGLVSSGPQADQARAALETLRTQ